MRAFVDSREPKNVKLKCVTGNLDGNFTYDEKKLPQADFYLPEHDVAIERKEASDFASSTTDGRLSEQADRMMAEHDHVFVIIENTLEGSSRIEDDRVWSLYNLRHSDINNNSITGMQTSLAVKRGIKIIYTESIDQTIYAVNRIFERFMDEEHESADGGYVKTADTGEVDDVNVKILCQIDGVSMQKAKKIADKTSISNLARHVVCERSDAESIKDELMKIDGIGGVIASRIIEVFE